MTDRHSRQAVTHYETIREYPGYAHIRLRLETGRTHQIRVHMAYLGHPVAGDVVYGDVYKRQPRDLLSAMKRRYPRMWRDMSVSYTHLLPAALFVWPGFPCDPSFAGDSLQCVYQYTR